MPSQAETAQAPDATPPVRRKREIGDLRVREDIAKVIDAELPEGLKLEEDRVTLCAVSIRFHRIVKGTQYVALLYIDENFEELAYQSWFLSSVCLRIFTTTNGLMLDLPAVEIIAARTGLLPEDWRDELDACVTARIAKSKRITRIESWLSGGPETALPSARVWIRDMGLGRDDSQNERGDSFGQTAKPSRSDESRTPSNRQRVARGPHVFISYSHDHEDEALSNKLKKHLKQLDKEFETKAVWTDEDIKTGEEWFKSIEQAMTSARVVVALVTLSFLDSDFITKVELKAALDGRVKQEKGFAWIFGGACNYKLVGLNQIQAAYFDHDKPLNKLPPEEQDVQLDKVREKVTDMVKEILTSEQD